MIVIGLTGSVGTGKSTLAGMLESLGVPTHDADVEVHRLLAPGSAGFRAVAAAFPYFSHPKIYARRGKTRYLKRPELAKIIFADDKKRVKLEKILHPLVRKAQNDFVRAQRAAGRKIIALDIPLLFETGGENMVDAVIVTSAPYDVQRARVLARSGMNEEKFHAILARQMPDGEKCARGDYVVHTGLGRAHAMKELKGALRDIKKTHGIK